MAGILLLLCQVSIKIVEIFTFYVFIALRAAPYLYFDVLYLQVWLWYL